MPEEKKDDGSNERILAQISEYTEEIKKLKARLKPTPARVEVSLMDCNKSAKDQRAEKFSEAAKMKKAISMALARADKSKKESKPPEGKPV